MGLSLSYNQFIIAQMARRMFEKNRSSLPVSYTLFLEKPSTYKEKAP